MKHQNPHRITPENPLFPQTYMSSTSKIAFRIINDDCEHFRYEWRQYSSDAEEKRVLQTCDPLDPEGRIAASTILLFNSPFFKITSMRGDIWANRFEDVVAEFKPTTPTIQTATAYLVNLDTGERIPYTFQGEGLPATASFSVDQINLGHVSLEKRYEYRVFLKNTGKIPLEYCLVERKLPFLVFDFSPSRGYLNVNDSVAIHILLDANHVGQFNETFEFKIINIEDRPGPKITLFGRVIGPTFKMSDDKINYGTVSYGFLYTNELELHNTSDIPFDFRFSLTHDSSFECREFNVIPDQGTIPSYSSQKVKVDFIPISIKDYSAKL
ncbi:hypothetical protein TRFO_24015 [Tritrichomonas foetus]|uniref:HYDIN/VesB/CFA65-like Ig-like domain-containing protein n=1 Tax=Tritrichomonas foetus TaxID=1144522 RepID=A0A1J4K9Y8_9EUKA|nr:hypothetical protein TRFO_24015 [Tritrichomonas foetus]|eukprot:OHT07736.1 hypothetical protein TRFO_24015 [Tritrichomonas foetus]